MTTIDIDFLKEQLKIANQELKHFVTLQKNMKQQLLKEHSIKTGFTQSESFFLSKAINEFEDDILEMKLRIRFSIFDIRDLRITQYIQFKKRLNNCLTKLKDLEKTQKMFKSKSKNVAKHTSNNELTAYNQSVNSKKIKNTKEKINKIVFDINYLKQKIKALSLNT